MFNIIRDIERSFVFCFVVAICVLVHDVETICHLCYLLTLNCSFPGIIHMSEKQLTEAMIV